MPGTGSIWSTRSFSWFLWELVEDAEHTYFTTTKSSGLQSLIDLVTFWSFFSFIVQTCENMVGEESEGEEAFSCVVNTNKKITLSLSTGPAEWEGHCTTPR